MNKVIICISIGLSILMNSTSIYGQSSFTTTSKNIRTFFIQEDDRWGSSHLILLQIQGTTVTGYSGSFAQGTDENYIYAKMNGGLISGKKVSLYNGTVEPFTFKYSPPYILKNTGSGILKIPAEGRNLCSREDEFTVYESPNKHSPVIETNLALNEADFELVEIGRVEKYSNEAPTHGIWYKIRIAAAIEGWVFDLIHVI